MELFTDRLVSDAASPVVTYYDQSTGERIELSALTFDNWVAKTANLLCDELLVDDGDLVRLDLPLHWQSLVWLHASWAAGAAVEIGVAASDSASTPAVTVTTAARMNDAVGDEIVVLSMRPLGLPCLEPLPSGVFDYALAVPGHGDRFSHSPIPGDGLALSIDGAARRHDEITTLAIEFGLAPHERVLRQGSFTTLDDVVQSWAAPIVEGGSVVIVVADPADDAATAAQRLERIVADERVTRR